MSTASFPRIAVYGSDEFGNQPNRGCGLWAAGYSPVITAAEATPVQVKMRSGRSWDDVLEEFDGVVFAQWKTVTPQQQIEQERLVEACRELRLPLLAVDHGLHVLNTCFGGTLFLDLSREMPQALQHQHLPEEGDRHAINVTPDTRLAKLYGEGEIVVNSEHRRAVNRIARGFRVSAVALDGVVEAIETESDEWFALGVQWHPASASASGLDIQLFRGLVEACKSYREARPRSRQLAAA